MALSHFQTSPAASRHFHGFNPSVFLPRQDTAWRVNKQHWLIVTQATRKYFYMEIWLHRSKPPMRKSLVLTEMPLNEAKHSEPLRIRYAKIAVLSLLARSTRIQQGPALSTLREAGTKSCFFTPQLEVFQHDREPRKITNQQLLKWQKRVPAHVCGDTKLHRVSVTVSLPKCCPSTEQCLHFP